MRQSTHALLLAALSVIAASAGCTLIADVDQEKIIDETSTGGTTSGSEGGAGGEPSSATGGTATGGTATGGTGDAGSSATPAPGGAGGEGGA
jgi:hypothetical protein